MPRRAPRLRRSFASCAINNYECLLLNTSNSCSTQVAKGMDYSNVRLMDPTHEHTQITLGYSQITLPHMSPNTSIHTDNRTTTIISFGVHSEFTHFIILLRYSYFPHKALNQNVLLCRSVKVRNTAGHPRNVVVLSSKF